jgi:hypothetical protein
MNSYSWISHPAKERPVASVAVSIFILVVVYLVYYLTNNAIMVLIAGMIFFISLSTFYFPTRYEVNKDRVFIKYLYSSKERNLSAFRSLFPGRRGILLSPFLGPSRLENYRGFYLRYGKDNKDQVDQFLAELMEKQKQPQPPEEGREDTDVG